MARWYIKFHESCLVSCKVVGDMGDQQIKNQVSEFYDFYANGAQFVAY